MELLQLGSITNLLSRNIRLADLGRAIESRISGYLNTYDCCTNYAELENALEGLHETVLRRLYGHDGLGLDINSLSSEKRSFLGLTGRPLRKPNARVILLCGRVLCTQQGRARRTFAMPKPLIANIRNNVAKLTLCVTPKGREFNLRSMQKVMRCALCGRLHVTRRGRALVVILDWGLQHDGGDFHVSGHGKSSTLTKSPGSIFNAVTNFTSANSSTTRACGLGTFGLRTRTGRDWSSLVAVAR